MCNDIPANLFCGLPLSSVVLCLAEASIVLPFLISRSVLTNPTRHWDLEKCHISSQERSWEFPRHTEFEFTVKDL